MVCASLHLHEGSISWSVVHVKDLGSYVTRVDIGEMEDEMRVFVRQQLTWIWWYYAMHTQEVDSVVPWMWKHVQQAVDVVHVSQRLQRLGAVVGCCGRMAGGVKIS